MDRRGGHGATLAVAAYFAAPGGASLLFAFAGVVVGFFAPSALALAWRVLGAYGRQPDGIRPHEKV